MTDPSPQEAWDRAIWHWAMTNERSLLEDTNARDVMELAGYVWEVLWSRWPETLATNPNDPVDFPGPAYTLCRLCDGSCAQAKAIAMLTAPGGAVQQAIGSHHEAEQSWKVGEFWLDDSHLLKTEDDDDLLSMDSYSGGTLSAEDAALAGVDGWEKTEGHDNLTHIHPDWVPGEDQAQWEERKDLEPERYWLDASEPDEEGWLELVETHGSVAPLLTCTKPGERDGIDRHVKKQVPWCQTCLETYARRKVIICKDCGEVFWKDVPNTRRCARCRAAA